MKKLCFILGSLFLLIWLVDSEEKETPEKPESKTQRPFVFSPRIGQSLKYRIVTIDELKKGGSVNPYLKPKYTLLVVNALIDSQVNYEELIVERTLRKIVSELVNKHQPDGISIKLFHDAQNLTLGTSWIADADWWPRGHSFNPSNSDYIEAKEYHIFTAKFNLPKAIKSEMIVSNFSDQQRKRIFIKAYKLEIQASREANERYPMENPEQTSKNMNKNIDEADRLIEKYRNQIIVELGLTEEKLYKISQEGVDRNWPTDG